MIHSQILSQKYKETLEYLSSPPHAGIKYDLVSIKILLSLIGNPQDQFKAIHIAGTSGKGSTATIISRLLLSHGFKVGLTLSPHIMDIRERVQINNELISKEKFIKYFEIIKPAIEETNKRMGYNAVSYFQIMISIAYYAFAQENVDYAVIETGLGGLLDATNTISRPDKFCIITKIGLDHMHILGKTIKEIASQKAGIIGKNQTVVTCDQKPTALKVLKEKCRQESADLLIIRKGINYSRAGNKEFKFNFKGLNFTLQSASPKALYQRENSASALASFRIISQRDGFRLDILKIQEVIAGTTFPGRFDIHKIGKNQFIVDGAHNPQKMSAFTRSLVKAFPERKFTFFIAFKHGKDITKMLDYIIPLAEQIYVTDFYVSGNESPVHPADPIKIFKTITAKGFLNAKIINKKDIYSIILKSHTECVLTGSLYFISDFYLSNPAIRITESK